MPILINIKRYFNKTMLPSLLAISCLTACGGIFEQLVPDDEETLVCEADTTPVDFKKVAYWDGDAMENRDDLNYAQLTHLLYGYLTVNADASLVAFSDSEMDDFEEMIAAARKAGVKVAISIGGEGDAANLKAIAGSSSITNTFVDNVIAFVEDNDLEGVDLNWQSPQDDAQGELFETLVKKLSSALWADGYFLTISVVSGEDEDIADSIDSTVFDYVDFVNVRAFDSTNKDNLHSSRQDAIDAIDYWTGRCLIKNKLVLGIPFYSHGDSVDSYADIIDFKRADACVDESKNRNYNGIPTVIYKTNYAMSHAGGVMMQSLEQDTYKTTLLEYSLSNVISETASGNTVSLCQ